MDKMSSCLLVGIKLYYRIPDSDYQYEQNGNTATIQFIFHNCRCEMTVECIEEKHITMRFSARNTEPAVIDVDRGSDGRFHVIGQRNFTQKGSEESHALAMIILEDLFRFLTNTISYEYEHEQLPKWMQKAYKRITDTYYYIRYFDEIQAERKAIELEKKQNMGFQIEGDELKHFCEEDNGPEITIPERVKWIDDWVFHNCTKLTSVTIPDTVTWIGDFAFSGCTGLTSIIIPASVTHIGSSAFDGCTNLRSVMIHNPRINIGPGVFKNTPFLEDCPNDFVMCGSILIRYKGNATEVQIPDGVTNIGGWAFWARIYVTSVTIPESVEMIDENAFRDCMALESITIPDTVKILSDSAFYCCMKMRSLSIGNGVEVIGDSAFLRCKHLETVVIGDKTECIGEEAFSNCVKLKNVTIGKNVKTIADLAFYDCESLESIYIPDSVTKIGEEAFNFCTSLKTVRMSRYVRDIEPYTFPESTELKTN
jgi:hypothetical protein